jgi:hypothetical protein
MMAGSNAQSPSMASTAEEPLGGVAQRRCGLLCVLSMSSLPSHADTPPGRRFSISSCPPTILLPATTLATLDLPSRRPPTPRANCRLTSTCASATRDLRAAHLRPLDRERAHSAAAAEAEAEADTPLIKHAEPAAPAASSNVHRFEKEASCRLGNSGMSRCCILSCSYVSGDSLRLAYLKHI